MLASSTAANASSINANHARARRYVPADEAILLDLAPSVWFVFLRSIGTVVFLGALVMGLAWTAEKLGSTRMAANALRVGFIIAAFVVVWQAIVRGCVVYVLTEKRIVAASGVFRRTGADIPLGNVQHLLIDKTFLERVVGVGTIGIATSGTGMIEMFWISVPRPDATHALIRRAVDDARARAESSSSPARIVPGERLAAAEPSRRPLVIGLAGGIGSGKSEVAKLLGELGAVVVDSDKEAKAALDRPEVRAELVGWWGEQVLDGAGRIDRKKVAAIIFADPEHRSRLERLIHPLVRATREVYIAKATAQLAPAVVVDAPLLFEAGLDKECDTIVFVDSPREQRLARVASRGWDENELARREKTQISLDEKQRRADEVILNDADQAMLRRRVGEVWGRLRRAERR